MNSLSFSLNNLHFIDLICLQAFIVYLLKLLGLLMSYFVYASSQRDQIFCVTLLSNQVSLDLKFDYFQVVSHEAVLKIDDNSFIQLIFSFSSSVPRQMAQFDQFHQISAHFSLQVTNQFNVMAGMNFSCIYIFELRYTKITQYLNNRLDRNICRAIAN